MTASSERTSVWYSASVLRTVWTQIRTKGLIVLVLLAIGSGFIPYLEAHRLVILSIGFSWLFLFFLDLQREYNSKIEGIKLDLAAIRTAVQTPTYRNFNAASDSMAKAIATALERSDQSESADVQIRIIAVTARYSLTFLEDHLRRWIGMIPKGKRLLIRIATVKRETLLLHDQDHWKVMLDACNDRLKLLTSNFKTEIDAGTLGIERIEFDDLPNLHGVLVSTGVLFLGKTDWEFPLNSSPKLLVGQVPYTEFRLGDSYGGAERIGRFERWFRYYRERHEKRNRPG
ncbi:MAG: hypothetical protein QM770_11310 [Tepidisphaeraceae bacterium]